MQPYERLCEAMIVLYALWTFACHFTVWRDGNLYDLYRNAAAVSLIAAVAGGAVWAVRRRRAPAPPDADAPSTPSEEARATEPPAAQRPTPPALALGLVGFVLAVALWQWLAPNIVAFWWFAVAVLGGGYFYAVRRENAVPDPPRDKQWKHLAVWGLALLGAIIGLIAHRPDRDDSIYINMPAAIIDEPGETLLAHDEIHGVEGVPLFLPVYRIHSFELLNAAVGYAIGRSAIETAHWIAAPFWAFFIPLALAYLFRLITPRMWFWNTLTAVFVLLASGESNWGYGNFSFVRIWFGKSILISIMVPLLSVMALRFMREPRPARWIMLFLANAAAVGFSSTAVWVAPVVTGLALLSGVRWNRRALLLIAIGTAATAYAVGAGLTLRPMLSKITRNVSKETYTYHASVAPETAEESLASREPEPVALAILETTGPGLNYLFGLAVIACAWAFCPNGAARRYCTILPLGVLLVILNPYWDKWAMANITGTAYSRALWAIPFPVLAAVLLSSPLQLRLERGSRLFPVVFYAILLIGYADRVPSMSTLSPENDTSLEFPPRPKIAPDAHATALRMMELVPAGSHVIVSWHVSTTLPMFQDRLYPISARNFYTYVLIPHSGEQDVRRRINATEYVLGFHHENRREAFRESLRLYNVAAVAFSHEEHKFYPDREGWGGQEWIDDITGILREEGFEEKESDTHYRIWVRQVDPGAGEALNQAQETRPGNINS